MAQGSLWLQNSYTATADRTYNVKLTGDGSEYAMNPTQVAALPVKPLSLPLGGGVYTVSDAGTANNAYGPFNWSYNVTATWNGASYMLAVTGNVTQGSFSTGVGRVWADWTPGAGCPAQTYEYSLPGTYQPKTRYVIFFEPDDGGEPTVLHDVSVIWGISQTVTGTTPVACGTIRVQRFNPSLPGDGGNWENIPPPVTPPPPLPNPPPGPDPQPPPPDIPEPPPPAPPPPDVTPPGPPPTGGGGGDSEIIEWVKDISKTNRTQVEQNTVSNEYLKAIKDNTEYASERLKTIDESTQTIADDVKRKAAAEDAYRAQMPTTQDMVASAAQGVEATQSAMGTLNYTVPSVSTSAPNWTMAFTAGNASLNFSYDPFEKPWMNTASNWIRTFIAWALAYYFLRWCLDQLVSARRHVELAPQTRGNTVPGGFGGQVTAAIAAGIITATMVSMVLVIYAMWRDGAIGTFTVSNLFSSSPLVNAPDMIKKGLYVLEQLFPVTTAITCMINYMTFKFQVEASVVAAATFKRFINP